MAVLDTAGRSTLAAEPELTFHRVPDAAAVVFLVSADSGITAADQELWREHIAPVGGIQETCFIVLNKIDGLHESIKGEGLVLAEIDRQVRATADALGVAPTRIYALSAKQGLAGKIQGTHALVKSPFASSRAFRAAWCTSAARPRTAVGARRSASWPRPRLITSRLGFAEEQLQELSALQGKNQKLIETLARKAGVERARLEQARATMTGLRTVHNVRADELARLLDPAAARAAGLRARAAVEASSFSSRIGETLMRSSPSRARACRGID